MNASRKIPYFIVLSIIMAFLIAVFRPQKSYSEFGKDYYWTLKTHPQKKYDVVIYGDSRVYRGVSPEKVSVGTGLKAFNFGFSSGSMSMQMLDFAEQQLNMSGSPVMIIGLTPHSLTESAFKDKQFYQEMNRAPYDLFQRLYIDRYLTFFDKIEPTDMFRLNRTVQENYRTDGWAECSSESIDLESGLKSYQKVFENNPIKVDGVKQFCDKIRHWTDRGIHVVVYRPPTFPKMEELENQLTGFDEKEIARQVESAGGVWMEVDKSAYQTYDGSHLMATSAVELSKRINEVVKACLRK